jgi:myo-inositol-1(or 4)-monophosphatase
LKGNEIIYGVIHHPVTGDTYFASKGKGAFMNGASISVNAEHREANCTISYYCNYTTPRERIIKFKTALLKLPIKRLLDLWSPTLCYCGLASRRIEALINDGIEWYDYAAGKLIAMEAGAKVTDFWGRNTIKDEDNTFLITNGTQIHDFLINQVTRPIIGDL